VRDQEVAHALFQLILNQATFAAYAMRVEAR
jgi:hypothetical protein